MLKSRLLVLLLVSAGCLAAGAAVTDEVPLIDESPTADPKIKASTESNVDATLVLISEESTEINVATTAEAGNITNSTVIIEDPTDGLTSAVLFGIIAGIVIGVGIISAIIILIVKKSSGRYS